MADDVKDLLRCPICSSPLLNPSTLHCGHSICSRHSSCTLHSTPEDSERKLDVSLKKIIALVDRHTTSNSNGNDSDEDDPDKRPHKRPRTMPKDEDEDDEEGGNDLLAYLRTESVRERALRHDEPVLPTEPPETQSQDDTDAFQKELIAELSCQICFSLLYEPVTTPCQHTFCSRCLHRSLDHSSVCPICRQQLPGFAYFQNHPFNAVMLRIILHVCPTLYEERGASIEADEHNARLDTPIFVCHLSFPGMPTLLHFFEPRYRLMLRRCLASPYPSFGMIMSSSSSSSSASSSTLNSSGQVEYGTMLEIRSVQMLPDGRSMVETWGVWRFRILERGSMDGYCVGRIERIDDIPDEVDDEEDEEELHIEEPASRQSPLQRLTARLAPHSPPPLPIVESTAPLPSAEPANAPPSSSSPEPSPGSRSPRTPSREDDSHRDTPDATSSSSPTATAVTPPPSRPLPPSTLHLINYCTAFLSQLHTSTTPWVVQRLSYTHGPPPPSDPTDPDFDAGTFSFYVGMVLPIDEWEKAKLLPVRSVRMRLKMCVWWIEGLRRNWWFERGCVVL